MTGLILLFISAALVNNIILIKFLGICPFMGVSKKYETAFGMSMAVTFVMMISSSVTWLLEKLVLQPHNLDYLKTLVFILVIASLVQFVEIVLEKTSPDLYAGLGIFLPLITTNCAVFGVALLNIQYEYSFIEMLFFTFGTSVGFALALILFTGLRTRLDYSNVPRLFQGMPIAFITAGILSLAFMGFAGMVK